MATPYDREPILRKARDLIAAEWEAANVNGIGPYADPPLDLTVHTRGRDAAVSNPQVRLIPVDETPAVSGIAGDGTGPVVETSGLIQANAIAGAEERFDSAGISADPSDIAARMVREISRIWHSKAPTGLTDGSGTLEYTHLYPGQSRPLPDASQESNPSLVGYLVELNYEYEDKTPQ